MFFLVNSSLTKLLNKYHPSNHLKRDQPNSYLRVIASEDVSCDESITIMDSTTVLADDSWQAILALNGAKVSPLFECQTASRTVLIRFQAITKTSVQVLTYSNGILYRLVSMSLL